ncbi:2-C-methyl-D-erythritol 4-phosphate cytidylyltransferase [Chitinimonas lacunae]|uniref:2-C-methyl-D-erythritol 4-phosphate cytidylyltransferase n=1 Tax=Chitinimonas lacunae TaxID=1963018 RepID=A0ABV8MX11_9NEIS
MSARLALVPAAGSGSRMGSDIPKQYLTLLGKPLLAITLESLLSADSIDLVYLLLSPDDSWFRDQVALEHPKLRVLYCGGASRAETVRNGLLAASGAADDWILVHDAARPCLTPAEIDRLVATLQDDPVGGLFALPVADTVKRADAAGRVAATVPRDDLWRAQTPQMFRRDLLSRALAAGASAAVTDESSAVEALGLAPRLVVGPVGNIKVTYPADLAQAELLLTMQAE